VRPLFVTFEGLDGSGKSTHLRRVSRRLAAAGLDPCVTHEPGGTPLGERIRSVFLDPGARELDGTIEVLLVFASRRQHLLEVIDPALRAGRLVLCDRFTDSTYAYQGWGRGVALELIDRVDQLATGGRRPDRTLLFDLPTDEAQRRSQSNRRQRDGTVNRLDTEEMAFHGRVREGYLELARRDPDRFRVVDSGSSTEDTARQVIAALADLLPEVEEEEATSAKTRMGS
jgi:dTMP kinase